MTKQTANRKRVAGICRWLIIWQLLLLPVALFAQEDTTLNDRRESENLPSDTEFLRRPTVSLSLGFTKNSLRDLSISCPRTIALRLGRSTQEIENFSPDILRQEFNYILIANVTNELGGKSVSGEINADIWRFGLGSDNGYGYALGRSAIILYNSFGAQWSRMKLLDRVTDLSDSIALARFNGTVRFGTKAEGGVKVQIVPSLSVDVGYERSIVFPAHLFWKWLGSTTIEAAGQVMINKFTDVVLETAPSAMPIIGFLLKNGLSYGLYQLRKDKMNWPFDSDVPMMNDSFKIGLSYVF